MRKTASAITIILVFLAAAFSAGVNPASGDELVEDSWITLTPLPKPYYGFMGAAAADGKIYFLGQEVFERYDPDTDTWAAMAPPSDYYAWGAVVACQNKIYALGYPTQVYDPATGMWENRTSMPKTLVGGYTPVSVRDKIYLIGGVEPAPLGVLVISSANYVYDPETDVWSTMAPIPTAVAGYAAAVLDNKIYIISGGTVESAYIGGNTTDVVQIFDPETNQWTNGASIPTGVYTAGACSTSGNFAPKRIYVAGGKVDFSQGGTSADLTDYGVNLTQVYNPKTGAWSIAASIPDVRWDLSLVNVRDALYAVGGVNGTVRVSVSGDLSNWEAAKQLMSTVRVQAIAKYIPIGYDESLLPSPSPSSAPTASPTSTAEPFPTTLVIAASVAVVVAGGLLVYFKKRKRVAD